MCVDGNGNQIKAEERIAKYHHLWLVVFGLVVS